MRADFKIIASLISIDIHKLVIMSSQSSRMYNFPYEPYPEQQKLMHSIYECIESSSVGCFESPTGTGKSLSAICASFDWLLSEEKRILDLYAAETTVGVTAISPPDDSDWLSELYTPKVSKELTDKAETVKKYHTLLDKIAHSNEYKPRSSLMLSREHNQKSIKKNTTISSADNSPASTAIEDEDAEFALKHYDSEDEAKTHRDTMNASDSDQSDSDESTSPSHNSKRTPKVSIMDKLQLPQIFYCSRTHSQLAQFIAEMNKTIYTKADPVTKLAPIRCVTLGSRRNLCVNENVTKLKSESSMSESCLEMQKKGSKKVSAEAGMLLHFFAVLDVNFFQRIIGYVQSFLHLLISMMFRQAINEASCTTTASVRITTMLRRKG